MTALETYSALLLDETSHTSGSPQPRAEAIGYRSLEQQPGGLPTLSSRQRDRMTGGEPYFQGLLPATLADISPGHHQARFDMENGADLVARETLLELAQSLVAARLDDLNKTLSSWRWCASSAEPRLLLRAAH
jgi:hypothetical protein